MKKRIENIKKQYANEGKKILFVMLGFVTGAAIVKGTKWVGEKYPQMEPFTKYGTPPLLMITGWTLSSATEKEEEAVKSFGYGLATSGAFEAIRFVPVVGDFFKGLSGDSDLGRTYYIENDKPILELGEFGINALPMKSMEMQEAPKVRIELPELEGANNLGYNSSMTENLGYNSSITDDADISGII